MAQTPDTPSRPIRRRKRGFEAASALLSARVQKATEGRGFAVTRLLTHWPEIAGDTLARMTRPVRISHARGGFGATLTLLIAGPTAPLVEMQLPQLRERVNACYGYNAIQRIALTQTAAQGFAAQGSAANGFAEGASPFDHAPRAARIDPAVQAHATQAAQDVAALFGDPVLAAAMARLTLNVTTKNHTTHHRKDFS